MTKDEATTDLAHKIWDVIGQVDAPADVSLNALAGTCFVAIHNLLGPAAYEHMLAAYKQLFIEEQKQGVKS